MSSRPVHSWKTRTRQKGVALVESALTISIFLLMIFAAIEFSLLLYTWLNAFEGTRAAARYAIVNDPVVSLESLECPGGGVTSVGTNCDGVAACDPIVSTVQSFLPQATAANVRVTYSCSGVGFDERPEELLIPTVMVELEDYTYQMVIPTLIGFPRDWPLPSVAATRTGEDLYTVP